MKRLKLWRNWVVVLSLSLFFVACSGESEPDRSAVAAQSTPPSTLASTATTLSPSVLPTVTPTPLAQSPMPTATQTLTGTIPITVAGVATATPCIQEADIALANYPDLQTLMGCALGPALFDPVAINEFGPGPDFDRFMLWFSHELQIYVLRPDKSWQAYPDTWTEAQPTFACNPLEGEATSPPLPRRGFGKLWCEEAGLRELMGMVTREERLCQHTVLQPFQNGRLLACYEDATIRYFRVMNGGSWDQVLVR